MSREDICKSLLSKFYGLDSDCKEDEKLSTSKGIENFENLRDCDDLSEQLISADETANNQSNVGCFDGINDETIETDLSKSPHILTIDDFLADNREDSQEPNSDLSSDVNDKFVTKNSTRLEDAFMKTVVKVNDLSNKSDVNAMEIHSNISSDSISKAKKLWRQKTMLSKENIDCPTNLLSKFNGIFLDLNYMGLTEFPIDLLQHLKNLQMLYLDSNNLKEVPEDLFVVLKKLKWLDVRNNQLAILPSTLKGHESLETLLLQGNNLEKLPLELGLVPNLNNLQIAHNPLVFPPQDILKLDGSSIMNFLRKEWNKLHRDEEVDIKDILDGKLDKKPSTIICYESSEKNRQKKNLYNPNESKSSVRAKTWNYKPSSRCSSAGTDVSHHRQQLWKTAAKKMLTEQPAELQKLADQNVLAQWKKNYQALKSRESASNYSTNPPFALHNDNLQAEPQCRITQKKYAYLYDVRNFYKDYEQVQNSVKALGGAKSIISETPRSKRLKLRDEIDRINDLRKSINDLKLCTHLIAPEF